MARTTRIVPTTVYYNNGYSDLQRTINSNTEHIIYVPVMPKGQWITLPNGSKFRKSTSWYKARTWVQPAGIQSQTGRRLISGSYRPIWIRSNPGGIYGWVLQSGWDNAMIDPVTGVNPQNYPGIPTSMRNEAVTKALLKIADQKVNYGEALGTLSQTIHMVRSPLTSLVGGLKTVWDDKSLRPFLRRSIRDVLHDYNRGRVPRKAASKYLEYVYGWKPLVSDIYATMKLAKDQAKSSDCLISAHGSSRRTSQKKAAGSGSSILGPSRSKALVRCNLHARLDSNWQGFRALNQLGLANPLALAWELSSFSFVVDWVLPIGPVLNALTAPAGLIFVDGCISNRASFEAPFTSHESDLDAYGVSGVASATGTVFHEGYGRTTIGSWPLPGLWIVPDPLRGDRWLKGLALLVTNCRSFR